MVSPKVKHASSLVEKSVVFITTLFFICKCCNFVLSVLTLSIICLKICIMLLHSCEAVLHQTRSNPFGFVCLCKTAATHVLKREKCAIIELPLIISKKVRASLTNFFVYNRLMEYITVVIDSFWLIMQQMTTVCVPIIAILLIFGIVKGLLFNDR